VAGGAADRGGRAGPAVLHKPQRRPDKHAECAGGGPPAAPPFRSARRRPAARVGALRWGTSTRPDPLRGRARIFLDPRGASPLAPRPLPPPLPPGDFLIDAAGPLSFRVRVDPRGLRLLSVGLGDMLSGFSLGDMLSGLGLAGAGSIDAGDLFALKDSKALYVPALNDSLGALASTGAAPSAAFFFFWWSGRAASCREELARLYVFRIHSNSPKTHTTAVYKDPRTNASYAAGLYLSTKIAVPPLGIAESRVDVAVAAGNGTFAQSAVLQARAPPRGAEHGSVGAARRAPPGGDRAMGCARDKPAAHSYAWRVASTTLASCPRRRARPLQFSGSFAPMPFVNLTNLRAVWVSGKSLVRLAPQSGCTLFGGALWLYLAWACH
jgi:hypothetical protein